MNGEVQVHEWREKCPKFTNHSLVKLRDSGVETVRDLYSLFMLSGEMRLMSGETGLTNGLYGKMIGMSCRC